MQQTKAHKITILSVMLFAVRPWCARPWRMRRNRWKDKVEDQGVPDKATAAKGGKEIEDVWVFTDGKFTSTAMARKDSGRL